MPVDFVKRQLKLLDAQVKWRSNFHKQLVTKTPLLIVAIGIIVGVLIQQFFNLSIWLWLSTLTAAAITALTCLAFRKSHVSFVVYAALVCFICLGAIRLSAFYQLKPNDINNLVGEESTLATIRGRITSTPYTQNNNQGLFAEFASTDPTSTFYLEINKIKTAAGWMDTTSTIKVYVSEPVLGLNAGDIIQADCWLDRIKPATNPGQFNSAAHFARKNIFITCQTKSVGAIKLLKETPQNFFAKLKIKLQQIATSGLTDDLSEQNKGLTQALLLGYRGDIDPEIFSAFRRTGLLHLISLSGLHLGILISIIWFLTKTIGLDKPARGWLCIIAIIIFLTIVPARSPVLRASVIGFAFCGAMILGRKTNPLNTLAFAAIVLLLIRPTNLFEAPWQLSFASVLGILLFCDIIATFICQKTNDYFYPSLQDPPKILKRFVYIIIQLFSVGLAAWLASAGILLYHFHTITPLAAVWTIVAFPLVAVILVVGFFKTVLAILLPTVAFLLSSIIDILSNILIWMVQFIADLNISEILIGNTPILTILLYCIFTAVMVLPIFLRRPVVKKMILTIGFLLVVICLSTIKFQRINRNDLTITCLDVSHGQAVLIQMPGRTNLLFDAGSLFKRNVGQRIVNPFLTFNGINKIDSIFISHRDMDHINAIPGVVQNVNIKNIYSSTAFFENLETHRPANLLHNWLKEKDLKIQPVSEQIVTDSDATIKILWPLKDDKLKDSSENDKSMVYLLQFAERKILICSDTGNSVQDNLLQVYPDLSADIIILPHHGSATSLSQSFIEKINPKITISSCSRRNYESVIKNSPQRLSENFYTPAHGAITVSIKNDGTIKTEAFANRKSL